MGINTVNLGTQKQVLDAPGDQNLTIVNKIVNFIKGMFTAIAEMGKNSFNNLIFWKRESKINICKDSSSPVISTVNSRHNVYTSPCAVPASSTDIKVPAPSIDIEVPAPSTYIMARAPSTDIMAPTSSQSQIIRPMTFERLLYESRNNGVNWRGFWLSYNALPKRITFSREQITALMSSDYQPQPIRLSPMSINSQGTDDRIVVVEPSAITSPRQEETFIQVANNLSLQESTAVNPLDDLRRNKIDDLRRAVEKFSNTLSTIGVSAPTEVIERYIQKGSNPLDFNRDVDVQFSAESVLELIERSPAKGFVKCNLKWNLHDMFLQVLDKCPFWSICNSSDNVKYGVIDSRTNIVGYLDLTARTMQEFFNLYASLVKSLLNSSCKFDYYYRFMIGFELAPQASDGEAIALIKGDLAFVKIKFFVCERN